MGTQAKTEPLQCPTCLTALRLQWTKGQDPSIRVGDWSVCSHCGSANLFGEDLQLRSATPAELRELQKDYPAEYSDLMRAIKIVDKHNQQN